MARVAWQGWTEKTPKSIKDYLVDLAVYRAHRHEVPGPCPACGDTVFHRVGRGAPWRCRTCEPAMGSDQWLVVGPGPIGRALARDRERRNAPGGEAACAHCGKPIKEADGWTATSGGEALHFRCLEAWADPVEWRKLGA